MASIIHVLSLGLIPIALQLIFCSIYKSNTKELLKNLSAERFVLRLPKAYMWVFIVGALTNGIFLLIMEFFPNGTEAGWVYAIFSIFGIFCAFFALYTLTWKLECFRNEDFFIYRPLFGKGRKIFYRDVEFYRIETISSGIIIKTKTGRFTLDPNVTNMEFFLAALSKHGVPKKK